MIGIWANVAAIIVGTVIGWVFKKVLTDKYVATFWTALGLAALGVGAQTVVANLPKSHYPVRAIVFGAGFGLGMILEVPVLFIWFTAIYLVAKFLSASFFSPALITEMSIVGGLLIVAASFSLLKIREFKSIDMLPALLVPLLFFIGLAIF